MLHRQQRVRAEQLARPPRVCRRHQERVRSGGSFSGQFQHPRAERGQRTPLFRNATLVQHVQVVNHRLIRGSVIGPELAMPRADTKQEPPGVGRIKPVVGVRDGSCVHVPDVDDAGGHDQRLGRRENPLHSGQARCARARDPQSRVAEALHLGCRLRCQFPLDVMHPDRAEVDRARGRSSDDLLTCRGRLTAGDLDRVPIRRLKA